MRTFVLAVVLALVAAAAPQLLAYGIEATTDGDWAALVSFLYGYFYGAVALAANAVASIVGVGIKRSLLPWAAISNAVLAGYVAQFVLLSHPLLGALVVIYGVAWLVALYLHNKAAAA